MDAFLRPPPHPSYGISRNVRFLFWIPIGRVSAINPWNEMNRPFYWKENEDAHPHVAIRYSPVCLYTHRGYTLALTICPLLVCRFPINQQRPSRQNGSQWSRSSGSTTRSSQSRRHQKSETKLVTASIKKTSNVSKHSTTSFRLCLIRHGIIFVF